MNNKPATLDPKMKAIYDKVMSTVVEPPKPQPPTTAPSAITPPPLPVSKDTDLSTTASTRPRLVTESASTPLGRPKIPVDKGLYGTFPPTPPPAIQPSATIDKVSVYDPNDPIKEPKKTTSPFMPILLTFSGILFFVIYTIFWIKFFGVSMPFLPI
jgi:hypothetical protein